MDRTEAALLVERLLNLRLTITTCRTKTGYTCEITGYKTRATGVGETFLEALARSSWRWALN